jgi:aspartyl-tRNA(Asn)/glutamyl-tRNA(Gln) amidotransferase subunit C
MTRATVETVEHVAKLARLSLSDREKEAFARHLDQILRYAESIQALDTADVEPMSHAHAAGGFRADEPRPSLPRETVLAEAPDAQDGLYRVPRVIGG